MNWLLLLGQICGLLYLAILIVKAISSLRYLRLHAESEKLMAAVTILQPILGGDPNLKRVLASNLDAVPPRSRFWWLVDEDDELGNSVVRELQAEYPELIRIVVSPPAPEGVNPKTFKLSRVAAEIETEYVAVLDDDTTLSPDQLAKTLPRLADCEIYTGLPCYRAGANVWSSLVAHFVNNNAILTYLSLLNWIQPLTINGMYYVVKAEQLTKWNGWQPILSELCDDYAFAQLARQHGGRIHQGVTPQVIETTVDGPRRYFGLLHRWFVFANVLVKAQSTKIKILLFVMLGLPPLLLWGSLFLLCQGWMGLGWLVGLLVIRHFLIRLLHFAAYSNPPKFSPWISLVSEFGQAFHYIHSLISPVIVWRSRRIRVLPDGKFESLSTLSP